MSQNIQNENESWAGKKGFDEANYYEDNQAELGHEKPDGEIQEKVLEALSRFENTDESRIDVRVADGVVFLHDPLSELNIDDIEILKSLSGIKGVHLKTGEAS